MSNWLVARRPSLALADVLVLGRSDAALEAESDLVLNVVAKVSELVLANDKMRKSGQSRSIRRDRASP